MGSTKIEAFDLADALLEDINTIDTNTEAIQENAADIDALETEMATVKKSVSDGKSLLAEAITTKGISTATDASFETMATNIINIPVLDTSDANATAGDILSGKSAYVNGLKVSGSIESLGAQTITPGTSNKTIAAGQYVAGVQTIAGDANLVAGNIAKGKSIFGVSGTYDPLSKTLTSGSAIALTSVSGISSKYGGGSEYTPSYYHYNGTGTKTHTSEIRGIVIEIPYSNTPEYVLWMIGQFIFSDGYTANSSMTYTIAPQFKSTISGYASGTGIKITCSSNRKTLTFTVDGYINQYGAPSFKLLY